MPKRQDSKQAIEIYKQYLEVHPDSSRVAFILGKTLKDNGDYDLALQYLEKSLQLVTSDAGISDFSRNFIQSNTPKIIAELESRRR